ncbi:MAG: ABC transporter permease [Deltaproteobacteria bacterium]|nr:ABC transporter permease [Deltaproteobacteria bacterium]
MNLLTPISNLFAGLPGALSQVWFALSRAVLDYSSRLLSICALYYRLLVSTFSERTGWRLMFQEFLKQIYFTSVQGAHVLIFSALMLGLVVNLHATQELTRVQGEEYVGWLLVTIIIREVGPVWAAFFVLLHSGSAITVELGTMAVTREVEALELMGIDPYRYLGVPRFWGLIVSLAVLYVLMALAAVLGGFLISQLFGETFWEKYWGSFLHNLTSMDVALGFSKITSFGGIIATVSIYFGLKAERHLGEVAAYTSKGSLVGLVLVVSLDIILSTAYYL